MERVLHEFPHILPGGISIVSDERTILPSCCCGLEHWHEWRHILSEGQSPWTGHDPSPLVEPLDEVVHVWSDGGMGEKPSGETPITFGRAAFASAVETVAQDLLDFLQPLGAWLDVHAPEARSKFVQKFAAGFIHVSWSGPRRL